MASSNWSSDVDNSSSQHMFYSALAGCNGVAQSLTQRKISLDNIDNSNEDNKKINKVRKGKWTLEEEIFTQKIIELFNAGLLQTNDASGTTLRAYLAAKLSCDPMRITKKFTGTSCLGKKVYHRCELSNVPKEKLDEVQSELDILERRFNEKMMQMEKERIASLESSGKSMSINHFISTPAIDAMIVKGSPHPAPPMTLSDALNPANYLRHAPLRSNPYLVPGSALTDVLQSSGTMGSNSNQTTLIHPLFINPDCVNINCGMERPECSNESVYMHPDDERFFSFMYGDALDALKKSQSMFSVTETKVPFSNDQQSPSNGNVNSVESVVVGSANANTNPTNSWLSSQCFPASLMQGNMFIAPSLPASQVQYHDSCLERNSMTTTCHSDATSLSVEPQNFALADKDCDVQSRPHTSIFGVDGGGAGESLDTDAVSSLLGFINQCHNPKDRHSAAETNALVNFVQEANQKSLGRSLSSTSLSGMTIAEDSCDSIPKLKRQRRSFDHLQVLARVHDDDDDGEYPTVSVDETTKMSDLFLEVESVRSVVELCRSGQSGY